MVFEIVPEFKKKEWNAFVDASPYGDILEFWQWGDTKKSEGWSPVRVWVRDGEGGEVLIAGQVMVKRAPLLGNYMYIPHGPLFRPKIALSAAQESLKVFTEGLKKMGAESNSFAIEIEPKVGKFVVGLGEMSDGLKHFTD